MGLFKNIFSASKGPKLSSVTDQETLIKYVVGLLERNGYMNCTVINEEDTPGINIKAVKGDQTLAFSVIYETRTVPSSVIARLAAECKRTKVDFGIVVTNGTFSPETIKYGEIKAITLWDRKHLESMEAHV